MDLKFFQNIHELEIRISKLEKRLQDTTSDFEAKINTTRRHFILSKQGAPILDWAIINGYPYIDLSPTLAYEQYSDPNVIYRVLDVSEEDFEPTAEFDNYIKIPFSQLEKEVEQIRNSKGILFVISEDGLKSVLACEKLAKLGIYNCFNISGGYEYWPEKREIKKSA